MCQEGAFIVDNIGYYHDPKLATELTAEADWSRRGLYLGPHVRLAISFKLLWANLSSLQFDTLDVQVQNEFESYMQERGINGSLAMFIPTYAEYKEQKVRSLYLAYALY